MLSKKNILITIFFTLSQILKSEYIVFKKNDNNTIESINTSAHSKIFEILLKYQWPTCIAYFHEIDQHEIAKYTNPGNCLEEEYLRTKIKEIDKNLDLIFFPTFLCELFFIANYETYKTKFNLVSFYCHTYDIFNLISNLSTKLEDVFNYFSSLNNHALCQEIHLAVNNDLIDCLKNFEFYKQRNQEHIAELIEKNCDIMLDELLKQTSTQWKNKEDGKKILNIEYKAHNNNFGVIYRGNQSFSFNNGVVLKNVIEFTYLTKIKDDPSFHYLHLKPDKIQQLKSLISSQDSTNALKKLKNEIINSFEWQVPSRSISYGNSIFAGYFKNKGASVNLYIHQNNSIGYALFINKWLYYKGMIASEEEKAALTNLIDGKLFTISPLSTLPALFGTGTLFHPRSKSSYIAIDLIRENAHKSNIIIPGLGHCMDLIGYCVQNNSPIQRGAQLAKFVAERAELIKVPQSQGGFHFSAEIAQTYYHGQKYLAQSFELFVQLEPHLKQELGFALN